VLGEEVRLASPCLFGGRPAVGNRQRSLLQRNHLEASCVRMNLDDPGARPLVGVVVVVHPEEHVDVACVGRHHDAPVRLIDANRPQLRVAGALDFLVVDARQFGVLPELGHEPTDLLLLAFGDRRERLQKLIGDGDFDVRHEGEDTDSAKQKRGTQK